MRRHWMHVSERKAARSVNGVSLSQLCRGGGTLVSLVCRCEIVASENGAGSPISLQSVQTMQSYYTLTSAWTQMKQTRVCTASIPPRLNTVYRSSCESSLRSAYHRMTMRRHCMQRRGSGVSGNGGAGA
jgi:hypothetical protein